MKRNLGDINQLATWINEKPPLAGASGQSRYGARFGDRLESVIFCRRVSLRLATRIENSAAARAVSSNRKERRIQRIFPASIRVTQLSHAEENSRVQPKGAAEMIALKSDQTRGFPLRTEELWERCPQQRPCYEDQAQ